MFWEDELMDEVDTFFVLSILSNIGTEVFYFRDRAVARKQLFKYVQENWRDEHPGEAIPDDEDVAISAYFYGNERESYTLVEETLLEEPV
jgi:hypothetical protein